MLQLGVLSSSVQAEGGVLLVADPEGGDSALEHPRHLVQARHARRVYCDLLLSSGRSIINPLVRAANDPSVFTITMKPPTRAFSWHDMDKTKWGSTSCLVCSNFTTSF